MLDEITLLEILNSSFISFTFVSIILQKLQELQQLDQQEKDPCPQLPCLEEQQPLNSPTEQQPAEVCSSSE